MKLVTITNYFEGHRGGVEIVAGMLARTLSNRGLDVCWLAARSDPPPTHGGFRTESLSVWNIAERRLGFPFPLISPRAILKIIREVGAADVVLLHDSLCMPSVCAFLAAKLFSTPVVLVQHIGEIAYRTSLLRWLMRLGDRLVARPMLRFADQVVFISSTTRAYYKDLAFRRPPELIFNGVDASIFHTGAPSAVNAQPGRSTGAPIALFVGRFVEKKGLDLIRRVAELRPDVSWSLAGWGPIDPDEWRLPNVRVVRDRFGAGLAELYRSSDLLVLPSYGEGFPLVIQEALACGLPVICGAETVAADPQAAPWLEGVAVSGDAGEAAQALSKAIDRVLDKGRAGDRERSAFAQRRYAWSEAAERYIALFTDVRERSRRRGLVKPLRYLAVGALCAGLNNAILIGGALLGLHYALSLAVSFATVVVLGYVAHSRVTFGEPPSRTGFGRYAAAMLVNLPLSFVLLAGCDALHVPMIAAAPATTAMTLAYNYASSRWAIVRRPKNA